MRCLKGFSFFLAVNGLFLFPIINNSHADDRLYASEHEQSENRPLYIPRRESGPSIEVSSSSSSMISSSSSSMSSSSSLMSSSSSSMISSSSSSTSSAGEESSSSSSMSSSSTGSSSSYSSDGYEDGYGDGDDYYGSTGWSYRYCTIDADGNEAGCYCSRCDPVNSCSSGPC